MNTEAYPQLAHSKPDVLIVDDDEPFRDLLRDVLEEEGLQNLTLAADGEEAVRMLDSEAKRPVHVDLVDLVMPKLDGFGVLGYAREHRPEVEIIVITAYKDPKLAVEAKQLGASDFVAKPIMRRELLQTIENVIAS